MAGNDSNSEKRPGDEVDHMHPSGLSTRRPLHLKGLISRTMAPNFVPLVVLPPHYMT